MQRDQLEYPDGYSMYAGYFADHFGIDPSGTVSININANISGEIFIAAGPLPVPGTGFIITAYFEANTFSCCGKSKTYEMWFSAEGGVDGRLVAGGEFKGKTKANNSRGSSYRDQKTGRYAKGPKGGQKGTQGSLLGLVADGGDCPDQGCSVGAEVYIGWTLGAGYGIYGEATMPLKLPLEFSAENHRGWGVVGASISFGARGFIRCYGNVSSTIALVI